MAHRSRLAGFIIDCNTDDLDAATDFRRSPEDLGLIKLPQASCDAGRTPQ